MVKKVFYSFMILIAFILVSNFCYADYGVPMIIEYDAKIINTNGANTSDYFGEPTGVIPYGTVVHVLYENHGKAFISQNNDNVGINLEDIKPVSNEVDISKANSGEMEMYVYKEGAYLYNGPSIAYGKIEDEIEIPKGTIVKIEASTESWGYVEYNGVKGWVYIYTSDPISPYNMTCSLTNIQGEDYSHYYTIKDITLTSTVGANDNVGTIPAGEHINSYFYSYYPDPHGRTVYIEHGELKGWYTITEGEVYRDYSNLDLKVTTSENYKIYSEIGPLKTDTYEREFFNNVGILQANTECKAMYETINGYIDYICVEYNGKNVWIDSNYYSIDMDSERLVDVSKILKNDPIEIQTNDFLAEGNSNSVEKKNVSNDLENSLTYCVIGAIVIFVLAIIITKILNKKSSEINSQSSEKNEIENKKEK